MFRKPKKIQRRVFSTCLEDDNDDEGKKTSPTNGQSSSRSVISNEIPDAPQTPIANEGKCYDNSKKNKLEKCTKPGSSSSTLKSTALLSFADDDDEGEVFQVRKTSHSKKVMRMMDKERRKKKKEEREGSSVASSTVHDGQHNESIPSFDSPRRERSGRGLSTTGGAEVSNDIRNKHLAADYRHKAKGDESIQTKIHTDDFVLVVKKSEPENILAGNAALCAGRDDLTDDDDDGGGDDNNQDKGKNSMGRHRFSKPEMLKQMLENGSIPDAAMIHAARKRRQKAREMSDFIFIDEPKPKDTKEQNRFTCQEMDDDDDNSGEERIDMDNIKEEKAREEIREKFYSVQNECSEDSDCGTNDWENQQICKGVTGGTVFTGSKKDVTLSNYLIKSSNSKHHASSPKSTSTLLEQAYVRNSAKSMGGNQLNDTKTTTDKCNIKMPILKTPQEIRETLSMKLTELRNLNERHTRDVASIDIQLRQLEIKKVDNVENTPIAAAKYKFYQEIKCYLTDLIDCLNEKVSTINWLEKEALQILAQHQNYLIERRRQDVRDQAKEVVEASKPLNMRSINPDTDLQIRRAAEREGRRTRRRCDREKHNLLSSHLDGVSSDDEVPDRYQEQLQNNQDRINKAAEDVFNDANDEFYKIDLVLAKLSEWRELEMDSYKDAFVPLCVPKVVGPLIRLEMLVWSPFMDDCLEIEKMNWYNATMLYAWSAQDSEETLRNDPDVGLVPSIIQKIVVPKVIDIVTHCWDPLSTTQTLRLINFIKRIGNEYPLNVNTVSLKLLFKTIVDKMKMSLDNDVYIPIFPKIIQEGKSSFFQRQICSGLKLFRNLISWQGVIADETLRELAIETLLNRYLLLAMRVCAANDSIQKAYIVVNTLPSAWLQSESVALKSLQTFTTYIRQTLESLDASSPHFLQCSEKAKQILQRLHSL